MNVPLVFRHLARAEFMEAAEWYEGQREGLGMEFVAEVQKVLDRIGEQPDRFPLASGDIREAPIKRFPYCVYYRVKADRVVVLAVFHSSRDPAIWQSRN